MQLTEHFSLEELTRSDYALRHGLDNTPTEGTIENLKRLAPLLERIRTVLNRPMIIISGYRSNPVNNGVGGEPVSQHRFGCAADFFCHGINPEDICKIIIESGVEYDQLIQEYDQWVHVSIPNKDLYRVRKQALRKNQDGYSNFF